jgi:hypothetical protein
MAFKLSLLWEEETAHNSGSSFGHSKNHSQIDFDYFTKSLAYHFKGYSSGDAPLIQAALQSIFCPPPQPAASYQLLILIIEPQ